MLPTNIQDQIRQLQKVRDITRQELTHRQISGHRFNKTLWDETDLQLNQLLAQITTRINKLLSPYEKG